MKKAFATLAATFMLGATCIGFAACEEKHEGNSAKDIVSDKITAEEFAAAFDDKLLKNFKVEIEVEDSTERTNCITKASFKQTVIVENNKVYTKISEKRSYTGELPEDAWWNPDIYRAGNTTTELEYYYTLSANWEDENYIIFEDGNWKYSWRSPDFKTQVYGMGVFYHDSIKWEDKAHNEAFEPSNYEFSEEHKGYEYKGERGIRDTKLFVAKFKEGKLKAIYAEYEMEDCCKQKISYVFTYGGQSVTFPTVNS